MSRIDRKCHECSSAEWSDGGSLLASGYICKLNPRKRIAMGIDGKCADRLSKKREQYPTKDSE